MASLWKGAVTVFVLGIGMMAGSALVQDVTRGHGVGDKQQDKLYPTYEMQIRIEPSARRLDVNGTMVLPAAEEARPTVQLRLSDVMKNFKVEVVNPEVSRGLATIELEKAAEAGRPTWVINTWLVRAPKPFPPGSPVELRFSYHGGGGSQNVFYIGTDASFAGGVNTPWYPQAVADGFRLRGTGNLHFSVPPGYTVVTLGGAQYSAGEAAQGSFLFRIGNPTFFSFAAAKYTSLRETIGPMRASLHLLTPRENAGDYVRGLAKTVDVLISEFGPLPYAEFAIVEVPTEQAQEAGFSGASLEGMILANTDFLNRSFNIAYFGHEISHSWWPLLVAHRGEHGRYMMDEAMAQYGSLRAVEIMEGPKAAENYRRSGYTGFFQDEYSGLAYLERWSRDGFDRRLNDLQYEDSYVSGRLANTKGMYAWDMLSRTVGRDRFRQILKNFIGRHKYQRVAWEEMLQEIERGYGQDLGWFYQQWFERTGAPEWRLAWKQEGRLVGAEVIQKAPYYRLPSVEVQVKGEGCSPSVQQVDISGPRTQFSFQADCRVQSILLDPHFEVLHRLASDHKGADERKPH